MPDQIDKAAGQDPLQPGTSKDVFVEDTSQDPRAYGEHITRADRLQGPYPQQQRKPGEKADDTVVEGIRKPDNLTADQEEAYKNMQRDYTRKTQEVAQKRRELEERQRQLDERLAMLNAVDGKQAQNQPMTQQQKGILRELLQDQWDNMEPDQRAVWGTIDRAFNVLQERMQSTMSQQNQMDPRVVNALVQELQGVKATTGLQSLKQTYGENTISPMEQDIVKLCKQYGVTPEQALDYLDPSIKRDYFINLGRQQALEEAKRQRASSSSSGGAFPSAPISDDYVLGESVAESARRAAARLGPEAMEAFPELFRGGGG